MDYDALVADLQDWSEDNSAEYVAEIPDIIARAEDRVFLSVPKLRSFRTKETGALVASTKTMTPTTTDLRTIRSMHITVGTALTLVEKRSDTFIDDYTPDPTTTGVPLYYSEDDATTISFAPTPDSNYAYSMRITVMPTRLSAANTTTYLATTYPSIMLKAAYLESAIYLHYDATDVAERLGDYETESAKLALEVERSYLEENTTGA